jgi:hypothetical protein
MEQNFQWAGEVDDTTALEVGRFFGAQSIVSGTVSQIGRAYRMTIRALNVQTSQVQGQYNRNISRSRTITSLMSARGGRPNYPASNNPIYESPGQGSGTSGSGQGAAGQATAGSTTAGSAARQPVHRNGTYTFWPRPQAHRQGRDINAYLEKIKVRGGYFNMYFVSVPRGTSGELPDMGNWAAYGAKAFIQDLDQPTRRPVQAVNSDRQYQNGYTYAYTVWTFPNHGMTRFSFTQTGGDGYEDRANMIIVLEEIDMREISEQYGIEEIVVR